MFHFKARVNIGSKGIFVPFMAMQVTHCRSFLLSNSDVYNRSEEFDLLNFVYIEFSHHSAEKSWAWQSEVLKYLSSLISMVGCFLLYRQIHFYMQVQQILQLIEFVISAFIDIAPVQCSFVWFNIVAYVVAFRQALRIKQKLQLQANECKKTSVIHQSLFPCLLSCVCKSHLLCRRSCFWQYVLFESRT